MPALFAKLLLCILAAGATAAGLLVIRQHQIDTMHEITTVHAELREQERALWSLQVEIARQCQPQRIRESIARLGGEWAPLPETVRPPARPPWAEQYAGSTPEAPAPAAPLADEPETELGG